MEQFLIDFQAWQFTNGYLNVKTLKNDMVKDFLSQYKDTKKEEALKNIEEFVKNTPKEVIIERLNKLSGKSTHPSIGKLLETFEGIKDYQMRFYPLARTTEPYKLSEKGISLCKELKESLSKKK